MPIVIERGLNAAEFCLRFQQEIKAIGSTKAFGIGELVVLYSGPSDYVRGKLTTSFTGNWHRSQKQANDAGGRRIDDTEIGKYLAGLDLQTYFTEYYGTDRLAIEEAELEVWGCASREFMKAQFRKVASAVCGAAPNRVFRKFEVGAVVKNRRVRLINNRPLLLFRDFYKIHPDEAFRLFCLTELLEARERAQKENTKEAWADYRERRRFFILEREYAAASTPVLPFAMRERLKLQKRRVLAVHRLASIVGSAVAPAAPATRHRRTAKSGHKPS